MSDSQIPQPVDKTPVLEIIATEGVEKIKKKRGRPLGSLSKKYTPNMRGRATCDRCIYKIQAINQGVDHVHWSVKFSAAIDRALGEDGGERLLRMMIVKNPDKFASLLAHVMPKQLEQNVKIIGQLQLQTTEPSREFRMWLRGESEGAELIEHDATVLQAVSGIPGPALSRRHDERGRARDVADRDDDERAGREPQVAS